MKFTDRRSRHRQVTVGKAVEYARSDDGPRGWVSTTIKLYVGRKALEVK
jgi:hypothetical protein